MLEDNADYSWGGQVVFSVTYTYDVLFYRMQFFCYPWKQLKSLKYNRNLCTCKYAEPLHPLSMNHWHLFFCFCILILSLSFSLSGKSELGSLRPSSPVTWYFVLFARSQLWIPGHCWGSELGSHVGRTDVVIHATV